MKKTIDNHISDLHKIDRQRKYWLFLSAFVSATVMTIIIGWDQVREYKMFWAVVTVGLLVSVIWWYWTMRLVRHLIEYKLTEAEILSGIVNEIRYIKTEVIKKSDNSSKD